jgi:hypothetical protein
MPDVTVRTIDEMEGLFGGAMRKVRAELGLSSFGVQTVDLPPNFDGYPWHDHAEDGQEELYVALRGDAWLEVEGGDTTELVACETVARVGPRERRRVVSGPQGTRVLVVGGVPGTAYKAWAPTELGAPDSAAS